MNSVNTFSEGFRNFSLLHKKYLWTFDEMSIEKQKNMCYNKITKQGGTVQWNFKALNHFPKDFSDIRIDQIKNPK